MAKDVLLVAHNHFDPTWRRCFDREATFNGQTVQSYAAVEELCIDGWLKLADRGYAYSEGQAAVLEKYLERNPQKRDRLKELIRKGRFAVMLAGRTVQDSNLPTAEGLIRNFLTAMPFYRELAGEDHPGLKLAWLEDAFGNSPNYPQVLRGVGAEAACALSYRRCQQMAWVGIDGTKILCYDHPPTKFLNNTTKHPPCPACAGTGCGVCNHTGMSLATGFDIKALRKTLQDAIDSPEQWSVVNLGAEETLPDPAVADLVEQMNRENAGKSAIRFATPVDVYRLKKPLLEEYSARRDDTPTEDLNPAMPGCYVSRIRVKQRVRRISYMLIRAESILAGSSWRAGSPVKMPAELDKAWQTVAFCQFHDAITGTHIDSAYRELMDMLDSARAAVEPYVPHHHCHRHLCFQPLAEEIGHVRLGKSEIEFDRIGIRSIKRCCRDVFGQRPYGKVRRPWRIGELALDADFGDAWGQRIAPMGGPANNVSMVQLGDYNTAVELADGAIRWRGVYSGGDPKVRRLTWNTTVTPSADGKRLEFVTYVDWDAASRRLKVMVPVESWDDRATWEVPFGFIDRRFEPEKINYTQWHSNTMEFPALNWVRKEIDTGCGVAVLNRGLPCYRWTPGMMELSLVRSPEWMFCAVEPACYEFWDIDGQRDAGQHLFEYAIWPYIHGLNLGDLVRAGYEYNMPAPMDIPFKVEGDVVVTAWKPAQSGAGWILRMQDASGAGTTAKLTFDKAVRLAPTDLLERPCGQTAAAESHSIAIHKFGIVTLLLER
ncbi:MAG: glycosyl hydrolase [Planctomycetes bacterium]|nr:glycosyl hydrolase [Planctomycetota bacterium]